jgi:hypothetical protein
MTGRIDKFGPGPERSGPERSSAPIPSIPAGLSLPSLLRIVFAAAALASAAGAQASGSGGAASPRGQGRIVGVFDERTGAPIEGASVRDMTTGWSALTTATGTVSLAFVDTATVLIQIRKVGYAPALLMISNSVRDTVPVTLVLAPVATQLGAVVTTARPNRGPADTVHTLELRGFYDRRVSSAAPSNAFVTAEKLERITTLNDIAAIAGRDICSGNVYLDGVRILLHSRASKLAQYGELDHLIGIQNIAGIELYRTADVPVQYSVTALDTCATLIWTK